MILSRYRLRMPRTCCLRLRKATDVTPETVEDEERREEEDERGRADTRTGEPQEPPCTRQPDLTLPTRETLIATWYQGFFSSSYI